MNDELTIVKANSFVQASYSMTLDEMRILALTLGVFNPRNPTKRDFEFTVDEFCKHFPDVDHKSAYTQVQNAIRKISRRWMTLRDDEYVLDEVVFVTDRTYFKKEGRFRIIFHERLMPYIAELHDRYTEYKLINIGALSSTHSIRLYELCSQYRDTGWRQTSVNDLKDWLQVSDKYPRYNSFNQRVLTPAIAEINAKSDLLVDVEPIKRGRTIVALKFTIKSKKSEVKTELKRPAFPHKNKYGKFVSLNKDNPKMSNAEYGNYAKDCLKILEDFYSDLADVTTEDLRNYWVFLTCNASFKSKLGKRSDFVNELQNRGYKIEKCELVKIKK
ncbi:TPA: replication initiation protein [Pasteurella multocida]|nr:replication initiation protein [Pasteurella multocida]